MRIEQQQRWRLVGLWMVTGTGAEHRRGQSVLHDGTGYVHLGGWNLVRSRLLYSLSLCSVTI